MEKPELPAPPPTRPSDRLNDSRLIVLLKAPRPGLAKTRLAAALDDHAAAAIYRVLIDRTLAALDAFPQVELRFTPDGAEPEIQPYLRNGWKMRPQGDGDLGVRLRRASDAAFAEGATRVVLIGTDCPALTGADVRDAFDALTELDVVLGPAEDGGYWLLGLRRPAPELFRDIPWSTPEALAATEAHARAAGLSVGLLRRLADVDSLEDWRRWLREMPL